KARFPAVWSPSDCRPGSTARAGTNVDAAANGEFPDDPPAERSPGNGATPPAPPGDRQLSVAQRERLAGIVSLMQRRELRAATGVGEDAIGQAISGASLDGAIVARLVRFLAAAPG